VKNYIEYTPWHKEKISDIEGPILLDEMIRYHIGDDMDKVRLVLKERKIRAINQLEQVRGPVKDSWVKTGDNEKHYGEVYELVENSSTKEKFIRCARAVEFVD
jgi:hypothetical protein